MPQPFNLKGVMWAHTSSQARCHAYPNAKPRHLGQKGTASSNAKALAGCFHHYNQYQQLGWENAGYVFRRRRAAK